MIQEIAPHKFDLTYGQPKAQEEQDTFEKNS